MKDLVWCFESEAFSGSVIESVHGEVNALARDGIALMEMLSDVDDPRQTSNGTRHDFQELLVMTISAVLV